MKIGTYDIQKIIYEQLTTIRAEVPGGRSKLAKDMAKKIYELLEENGMDNFWNEAHDFPAELEPTVRKLEKGLGLNLMRKKEFAEIYEWIAEQEENGKLISQFAKWATSEERAKYLTRYRFNPGLIKIDYPFAFNGEGGYNPQGLEVTF